MKHRIPSNAFVWFIALFLSSNVFAADLPSLHQVYQAAAAGRYAEAQSMMDQVLRAHPNSAKAHYVEAELLAKQHQFQAARSELATAERLEPGLPFAKSQSVAELRSQLATDQRPAMFAGSTAANAHSFPWGGIMLAITAIVMIVLLMRLFVARAGLPQPVPATGGTAPWQSGNPSPMMPSSGGLGSNLATGLATGVAVGAGMVAGEALAHHFLGNGSNTALPVSPVDNWAPSANDNMGGNDFGINDATSWDDNSGLDSLSDLGSGDDWN